MQKFCYKVRIGDRRISRRGTKIRIGLHFIALHLINEKEPIRVCLWADILKLLNEYSDDSDSLADRGEAVHRYSFLLTKSSAEDTC